MKINFLLLLLASGSIFAKNTVTNEQQVEVKEIIGSGIFDVNKIRKFTIDTSSRIYLDEIEIDYTLFEIIGSGYKSSFTLTNDVNSTVDSGTVNAIELTTNIKGLVTSTSPLMVLDQRVLLTGDTLNTIPSAIAIGDSVSISGYLSHNNSLKATKIMPNIDLNSWKLRGFASDVTASEFKIGSLLFNRNSESLIGCTNGFNNDSHVEIKMTADISYQTGNPINTIQSIKCLKLNLISDLTTPLPTVMQGFVSQTQGQDFWLDDIRVNTSNQTEYENGESGFIDDAVNVEVQGIFNPQTSELEADVIRFLDHRIEITMPVSPENIVIDESITLNGVTFKKTPQTKQSDILSNGIVTPIQIQIQGYIDSKGNAFISKVLDKGMVDINNVSIRGDISSHSNPMFTILNFQIDSSNSLIINQGSGIIDVATFFGLIDIGSQVELKNASYNISTELLENGTITIKKASSNKSSLNIPSTKEIIGSGIIGGFVTATITATPDQLFVSGFE